MDIQIATKEFSIFYCDPVNGKWSPPLSGYLKLNVYGSFKDGRGSFGGILRDNDGNWVWGFSSKCSNSNPLNAELQG